LVSFGLGLGGFYGFPLASFGFKVSKGNEGLGNPRKRQSNQGKSKEAISPYNASIMPVT
jgi:hypothetical protein